MKKFIQLAILLFAVTSVSMANDLLPSITLKNVPSEKKFTLSIEGLKDKAEIILTDESGQILLSQETKGEQAFAKVFNLNQLPEGEYFLTVSTSLTETVQPLTLTENGVLLDSGKKREFFKPVIRVAEGHVDISLFNGRIGDVSVRILDHNNVAVFQEKLENVLVVEKRYRLAQLPWGNYSIEVATPSKTYYKAFDVR